MGYRKVKDIALPVREGDVAYLAGIVDGEGHITVTRVRTKGSVNVSHSIRVVVTNTDKALIKWLCEMSDTAMVKKAPAHPTWKTAWNWQITGVNAEAFLRAILPWLRVKRRQAELCLELRDLGRHKWKGRALDPAVVEERERIAQEVIALNRCGVV